jgi:hypothetical protein
VWINVGVFGSLVHGETDLDHSLEDILSNVLTVLGQPLSFVLSIWAVIHVQFTFRRVLAIPLGDGVDKDSSPEHGGRSSLSNHISNDVDSGTESLDVVITHRFEQSELGVSLCHEEGFLLGELFFEGFSALGRHTDFLSSEGLADSHTTWGSLGSLEPITIGKILWLHGVGFAVVCADFGVITNSSRIFISHIIDGLKISKHSGVGLVNLGESVELRFIKLVVTTSIESLGISVFNFIEAEIVFSEHSSPWSEWVGEFCTVSEVLIQSEITIE